MSNITMFGNAVEIVSDDELEMVGGVAYLAEEDKIMITEELYKELSLHELECIIAHEVGHKTLKHTADIMTDKTVWLNAEASADAFAIKTTKIDVESYISVIKKIIKRFIERMYGADADFLEFTLQSTEPRFSIVRGLCV